MPGTFTELCVRTVGEAFFRKEKRTRYVEKSVPPSLRFSLCRFVTWNQRLKSLLDFYEIRCRIFLKNLEGTRIFCKNGVVSVSFDEKASRNFYPCYLYLLINLFTFRCRMSPRNAVEQCEVHEDRHSESSTLNTDVNYFFPYFPNLCLRLGKIQYETSAHNAAKNL